MDLSPPKVSAVKLTPRRFKAANSGPSLLLVGKAGARVTFVLSEPASVMFRVERASPGHSVKGRCQRQTHGSTSGRLCTYYTILPGSLSWHGKLGVNTFSLTGRLNRNKLARGSYRLLGTARDISGNVGAPVRVEFTIT